MKKKDSIISNYKDKLEKTIDSLDKKFEYEFNMSLSNGYSVTSRSGKVENIEHHQDMALNVSVYKDFKKGSVSTNDLSDKSINQAIKSIVLNKGDIILITGSLYLCSEVLNLN